MNGLLKKLFARLQAEAGEGQDLPGATPQEGDAPAQDDRWSDFLLDEEPVDLEEEIETPPAEPAPAPVEEPAATPAEPEVPAQEIPEAPVIPAQAPITPEQLAEYKANFQTHLTKQYAFSEEEVLSLQTEPEKVLPQMAARLHMEVLDNVMQHVYQALPNVIQSHTQSSLREQKAQEEFFGAWPELRGAEQQVLQMGQMFRQMNPKATPQEAIQRIGEITMAALGKKRATAPAAETFPEPPPAPFRPAAPGRVASPLPGKNKWEALMDDDD